MSMFIHSLYVLTLASCRAATQIWGEASYMAYGSRITCTVWPNNGGPDHVRRRLASGVNGHTNRLLHVGRNKVSAVDAPVQLNAQSFLPVDLKLLFQGTMELEKSSVQHSISKFKQALRKLEAYQRCRGNCVVVGNGPSQSTPIRRAIQTPLPDREKRDRKTQSTISWPPGLSQTNGDFPARPIKGY